MSNNDEVVFVKQVHSPSCSQDKEEIFQKYSRLKKKEALRTQRWKSMLARERQKIRHEVEKETQTTFEKKFHEKEKERDNLINSLLSDLEVKNEQIRIMIDQLKSYTSATTPPNTKEESTGLQCPICLENMTGTGKEMSATKCGHCFCHSCIQQQVQARGRCPICRTKIRSENLVKLYLSPES